MSENVEGIFKLFSLGFGLNPKTQGLILRVAWVSIVSFHILWVCGWLAFIGLASPFAKAEDFARLAKNVQISATINLSRELRDEYGVYCESKTRDPAAAAAVLKYIEQLQVEYQQIIGTRYPEPQCS
ncbi:MAG: hypothetical protein ACREQ5_03810 [Candidatus Dormibacteria bacterium]